MYSKPLFLPHEEIVTKHFDQSVTKKTIYFPKITTRSLVSMQENKRNSEHAVEHPLLQTSRATCCLLGVHCRCQQPVHTPHLLKYQPK